MLTCLPGQVGSAWKASRRHYLRVLDIGHSRTKRALMAQTSHEGSFSRHCIYGLYARFPKTYTNYKMTMKKRAGFSSLENLSLIVQPTYPTQTRLWVYLLQPERHASITLRLIRLVNPEARKLPVSLLVRRGVVRHEVCTLPRASPLVRVDRCLTSPSATQVNVGNDALVPKVR